MAKRTRYVLDGVGPVEACRLVLAVTAGDRTGFEVDVPWTEAAHWPAEVEDAARTLATLGRVSPRSEMYAQTGLVHMPTDAMWAAFDAFAPYAYDASVWGDGVELVSLADCGESVVTFLTEVQADAVRAALGAGRLMPLEEWRRTRRGPRS